MRPEQGILQLHIVGTPIQHCVMYHASPFVLSPAAILPLSIFLDSAHGAELEFSGHVSTHASKFFHGSRAILFTCALLFATSALGVIWPVRQTRRPLIPANPLSIPTIPSVGFFLLARVDYIFLTRTRRARIQ